MQPATELGPPPGLSRRKSKAKGAHTPGTRRKPAAPASEGGVPTAHAEGSAGAKDVANSKSKPSKKGRQQRTQKGNGAKQPAREQQAAACVPQKEKGRAATPAPRRRNRKPIFKDYIEGAALEQALAAGTVYKAVLRVNAGDRTQGFCTIPGLPNDIFLRGWKVQNRAIEGDTVAIRILPTSSWFRMGGKPTEGERRPRCKASTEVATPSTSSSGNILLFASQARGDEEEGAKRALAREMTPPVWATVAAGPAEHPSDGVVASPALMPSPSGGELGISMEQDPWEVLEEGEAESSCAAEGADAAESPSACAAIGDDDEGGDGEAYEDFSGEGSMLSFVASMANAKISDPAPALCTPTPAEPVDIAEQPWAAAGSAVEATEVLARLLKGDWDGWRATAEVVAIVDPSPRRSCVVGVLRADGNNVIWDPCDPRLPRAFVKDNDMPSALRKKLLAEAKDEGVTARTLVCGTIASWNQTHPFPTVVPNRIVGRAGGLQAEVAALLTMERVEDDDQFTPEILQCLPTVPWSISEADVGARKDLRSQRIFSIDPPTARDLDDALSIEVLDGGLLRIGVHIADVSHFVKPGSALDEEAASRSTSVYLVDRVVPMLPRLLCEELCSLNPGVDRLAVSIIWDMTEEGDIQDMWIGKTIICSCAKLSYPMVQEMIEGDGTLPGPDAPPPAGVELHCGQRWADVVRDSLMLHKVASNLRRRRFADGALRLDNARLFFHVNEEGMPVDFGIYEQASG